MAGEFSGSTWGKVKKYVDTHSGGAKLSGIVNTATPKLDIGRDLSKSTLAQVIQDMFVIDIAPTISVLLPSVRNYEKGTTVENVVFSVKVTKGSSDIRKITLLQDSTVLKSFESDVTDGGTFECTIKELSDSCQLIAKVDTLTKGANLATKIAFNQPKYYGVYSGELTASVIKKGSKGLDGVKELSTKFSPSNQSIFYAYPASYGIISKIVNGVYDYTSTFTKKQIEIDGTQYNVYTNDPATATNFALSFN